MPDARRPQPRRPRSHARPLPHHPWARAAGRLIALARRRPRTELIPALVVGTLVLVSSIAGVGAASGAEGVATTLHIAPRLTVSDPVLGPADAPAAGDVNGPAVAAVAAVDPGLVDEPAVPTDGWSFAPVVVDASASPAASPAASHPPAARSATRPSAKASTARPSFAPLLWPVAGGYVSQSFGCTGFPWEPPLGSCAHFHSGIDIAAPYGTPIRAAAAGTVVFAGWMSNGGGFQVWVSDGGNFYTGYHHMAYVSVRAGQRVGRGQRLGAVGMSGSATGPHCHFMVSIGPWWTGSGTAVDPRRYL